MSNYLTDIIPEVLKIVSDKTSKLKVAYVKAPPIGKSTRLVPDVWNLVHSEHPEMKGIYCQRLYIESLMLHSKFTQFRVFPNELEATLGGEPSGTLDLLSYHELDDILEREDVSVLRSGGMVFFIDIESVATVRGELLVGQLVRWLQGLTNPTAANLGHLNLTIILLSTRYRTDVIRVFEKFALVKVSTLTWTNQSLQSLAHHRPSDAEQNFIQSARSRVKKALLDGVEIGEILEGPGPCVLAFMSLTAATERIANPLLGNSTAQFEIFALTSTTDAQYIDRAMKDARPKLVCVDPTFPISLPFRNVQCIISPAKRTLRVFDCNTSQYPLAAEMWSKPEIDRQWAWACKAAEGFGHVPPELYAEWDMPWYEKNSSTEPVLVTGEFMSMCLHLIHRFGSVNGEVVPVPILQGANLDQVTETRRRLEMLECIGNTGTPKKFTLTKLGKAVISLVLGSSGTDMQFPNIHIAIMLAHVVVDSGPSAFLSVRAKRVVIRMAVILSYMGTLVLPTLEAVNKIMIEDEGILESIRDSCVGISHSQAGNGAIWVALGFWLKVTSEGTFASRLVSNIISTAKGNFEIRKKKVQQVVVTVYDLEKAFGMTPCQDEIRDNMLTDVELKQVNFVLTRSYLDQLVYFAFPLPDPVDLVSLRKVILEKYAHPIALSRLVKLGKDQNLRGGFAAMYDEAQLDTNGNLHPMSLTLLPNPCLASIEQRFHGRQLLRIMRTTYPIPY